MRPCLSEDARGADRAFLFLPLFVALMVSERTLHVVRKFLGQVAREMESLKKQNRGYERAVTIVRARGRGVPRDFSA